MTFARALTRCAELLGWDGCAQILECSESLVRKLSDPDTEREISLQKARRLDAAYMRAGGEGRPFQECLTLQLDIEETGAGRASTSELIAMAGTVAKETGEAVSFALAAIQNRGSEEARQKALREVEEGIQSLTAMAASLGGAEMLGDRSEPSRPN